ncbi:secreted Zn-dependent insulinase-like peptidase [Chromohalobacter marismortui]|uniref:Protease 3 n=1 Tax=Chromohalobacter marismortui TaxID=42055 RepID=A0A4R7NIK9_9GAMM|nr:MULTISPECIES: insulinase family protein [Chromohalobacter]MCI0510839.1 insulinase family protein [Chromohalobacter sp.]MCI0592695.1 insulinase family protein [Chromohalobacter sp.]TDU20229.1 secreted Zn-dependent insulinase-like peptidase [Chromohalobacter marismortui]
MFSSPPLVCRWLLGMCALCIAVSQTAHASDPVAKVVAPITSPNDMRHYRALTLDNGLEVLLVSDPQADKAAAAMNVAVGSMSNPDDVPGLAHFLEHMLFLGTDRYPQADAYQNFISAHGGDHNAFTASRDTNYFFDIEPQALPEALNRFSRFFISPRFNPEYVDRERNAVNSEYQARLRDDSRRLQEAINQALNPEHPMTRFSVGSLETLQGDDSASLRDRLVDFYKAHYGANVMHLTVIGPQSLDKLEALVRKRFAAIPDRHLSRPEIDTPLVTDEQLPARLRVKSLSQDKQVRFLFPIPDPQNDYRTKPADYLANLLGHEGEGSLLAALRHKGWADGLSAGTMNGDGRHALFAVSVSLTPEGAKHIARIQASLFEQIERIRQQGLEAWRYAEQARLNQQAFRFQQPGDPIDQASQLAMNLAYYPLKDVQYAPYRMDGFDATRIRDYLDKMTPAHLLRVYSGPNVNGDTTSPYFDAPYTLTHVSAWPEARALDGLGLPPRNPFIAEDLEVRSLSGESPSAIVEAPSVELWHLANDRFGTPRVEWRFSLQNPDAADSARNAALTRLLAGWITDSLNERFYPARLAGQSFDAYAHPRGITLTFSGWRDRQIRLMNSVAERLKAGKISQASFARVKYRLSQQWQNAPQAPLHQQMYRTLSESLLRPQWTTSSMLEALNTLSVDDLRRYRDAFLGRLYLQAMAVGNLDADLARREGLQVANTLAPTLQASDIPHLSPLAIPDTPPTLHPRSTRNDAAVLRYLQGADRSLGSQARLAVLGKMLEAPFYNQLRTQEQLGYIVMAGYSPVLDAPGLAMLVQSPDTPRQQIAARMDAFLDDFDARIQALDASDLVPYRDAVSSHLRERANSLGELTHRYWQALAYAEPNFSRREQLAARVESVEASTIRQAWRALRHTRPLTVSYDAHTQPSDVMALTRDFRPLPAHD